MSKSTENKKAQPTDGPFVLGPMESNWEYLKYLAKHKYEVYQTGSELGAPRLQLLKHDWSKFKPSS